MGEDEKAVGRFFGSAISALGLLMMLYCEMDGCSEFLTRRSYSLQRANEKRRNHSHTLTYVGIGVPHAGAGLYGACEKKDDKEDKYE